MIKAPCAFKDEFSRLARNGHTHRDGIVKGLVRAVGVSNYGPKQLLKIHDYLKARGVPLCSAQVCHCL